MGPHNQLRRFNKKQKRLKKMQGEGLYIYQNITGAEIFLPKPTHTGRLRVGPREKFEGDSYFKCIRELMCIQEVIPTTDQKQEQKEEMEEKLLTEVPPSVTHQGQVEYVVATEKNILQESPSTGGEKKKKSDVLLVETPLEGVRIIR